jgi:hypothetical protein
MKTIITLIIAVIVCSSAMAQSDKNAVERTITQFVKASGSRDVHSMYYLLHEKFHGVVSTVSGEIVFKSDFMKLLGEKKLGGEEQKVELLFLDLSATTGSAKIKLAGSAGTVEAFVHLIKDSNGLWQILHILPARVEKV